VPEEEVTHPMIGMVQDDCSRCDKESGMCKACDCAEGGDCVDAKKCAGECTAPGDKYMCTWNATKPQCVVSPDGKLTKDSCAD
jgi:hypothetical protein